MFLASRAKFTGLACGILQNKEDAEDAVQDALVSAYVHLRRFEGRSAIKTWFTRVVPERVLDDPAKAQACACRVCSRNGWRR
jgi:DNA-directed RNA polymerase specialized sigma24 family protein